MEEKNSDRKPIEERDIPISVPSVDDAWNDMRKKLDREMPIVELEPNSWIKGVSKISYNWLTISISLISMIAVIFFMFKNIDPVSQVVTDNQRVSSGEKIKSAHEADESSLEFDVHTNEPKAEPNKSNQLISDSVNAASSINEILTNEKQQDLKSIVISDSGNGKFISANQFSNRSNKNKKSIRGKNTKSSFPTNMEQENPEPKATKEKKYPSNTSVTKVNETPAVANTNTNPIDDPNLKVESNQLPLNDSTSMSKKEILSSDSSKMKGLFVSKNFGGPDSIGNSGKWRLQAGLSWSLQLPFSGTRGYFQGPNTSSQPYRVLFPALWLQSVKDKSMLSLEINPFMSNLLPEKPFRTSTTNSYLPDTTIIKTEIKTLYKVFGFSASVGYNYNIAANWWVGGNLQFCWWANGIAYSNGLVQKTPVNGGSATQVSSFEEEYQISDEWSYFNRAQFFLNSELQYRKQKWQAGLTAGIAATPLAKKEGPGNSFRMALFYRWALYTKR